MTTRNDIRERLRTVFAESLQVDVPAPDAELIESGILDSLHLVELLAALEEAFDMTVPVDEVDIDNFRTFDRLAAFVARQCESGGSLDASTQPPASTPR